MAFYLFILRYHLKMQQRMISNNVKNYISMNNWKYLKCRTIFNYKDINMGIPILSTYVCARLCVCVSLCMCMMCVCLCVFVRMCVYGCVWKKKGKELFKTISFNLQYAHTLNITYKNNLCFYINLST